GGGPLVPATTRARPLRLLLAYATAAVLTLAGCSGDKSDSDDKAAPATAPATTASQAAQGGSGGGSTQQGAQGSGGAEETSAQLADGTHYAYLKTIDAARRTITVDVVQY